MDHQVGCPVIYIVDRCLYKARLNHLTQLAKKSAFLQLKESYGGDVTHVVAQTSTKADVIEYLAKNKKVPPDLLAKCQAGQLFVDVSWFTACMKAKKEVPVAVGHLLKSSISEDECSPAKKPKQEDKVIPSYACQRCTPLNHKNKRFTEALEILEEHALYRGDANASARSLAFRRGSSTLKSLNFEITELSQLKNLPHIDLGGSSKPGHCKRVIMDILANGHSSEVEDVSSNEFYTTMKLFCGIFGVGPQTARKWYHDYNMRRLDDIKNCSAISLTRDQGYGLEYFDDLNAPLPLAEAKDIEATVRNVAVSIQDGLEITLVGGFRRSKTSGHDVDLLITHPEEGKEKNVLHKVLVELKDSFVYTDKKAGSADKPFLANAASTTDHFEKCYGIFKVKKNQRIAGEARDWTARRVDLIVVPYSQFAFALLGWTGSKHFERELRRYSKEEKQIVLTSHGMYTLNGKQSIAASSEQEIFEKLGLVYQEPANRNC